MDSRVTLLLALLFAAALGYAWFDVASDSPGGIWEAMLDPHPTPPGESVKRLLSFDPAAVTSVRVRQGDVTLQTKRTDDGWSGIGRRGAVEDLLHALADLAEILVLDATEGEPADYGLDPAETVVELERSDGAPIVLLIGHRNPSATAVYARIGANGPVVLTGALVLWEIDKAVKAINS